MVASWRAAHAYSPDQDVAEGFIPMKPRVRIRLGLWDDILAHTLPADAALSSVTLAMMHCARTVALANTHRTDDAEIEKTHFLNARDRVPGNPNTVQQPLPGHSDDCRTDDAGRVGFPQGTVRNGLCAAAQFGRSRRQPALRRTLGLDAAIAPCPVVQCWRKKAIWWKPSPYIAPIWAWMTGLAGPASIRAMSGECMACANA